MKLLTAEQMRALDRRAIDGVGIPGLVLMENAGRAVARQLLRRLPGVGGRVVVVAGKGNNGGDGLVAARALAEGGVPCDAFCLVPQDACTAETARQWTILERGGVPVRALPDRGALDALGRALCGASGVVDALFGVGIRGAVRGHFADAIRLINEADVLRLAVDVPSGADADGGRVDGEAVRAHCTVTLGLPKTGLLFHPARAHVGDLVVAGIGYPRSLVAELGAAAEWLEGEQVGRWLPPRTPYSHKGSYGKVLLVAGSEGFSGAAALAAQGALRGGAGLVHLAYPTPLDAAMAALAVEAIKHPLPESGGALSPASLERLLELGSGMDAVALGPGLSQRDGVRELVRRLTDELSCPLVVDADGLNALDADSLRARSAPTLITPHPGELARLIGGTVSAVEADRLGCATRWAASLGAVVLLKGVPTVIAEPGGRAWVVTTGHSGLAKGGSGDVLTGIALALCGQGLSLARAACCAAWAHGRAAELLGADLGERGMLPGELPGALARVWRELEPLERSAVARRKVRPEQG